jgi:hypothetical protein
MDPGAAGRPNPQGPNPAANTPAGGTTGDTPTVAATTAAETIPVSEAVNPLHIEKDNLYFDPSRVQNNFTSLKEETYRGFINLAQEFQTTRVETERRRTCTSMTPFMMLQC